MSECLSFRSLMHRVRAGEANAAAVLVRRYEPAIRRVVRLRLRDARLGRVLDSMDVCQSVLASFFVRAALGQYDLERPGQLLRLLAAMARNKLANAVDRQRAACRDYRRDRALNGLADALIAPGASPSEQFAAQELLDQARRRLTTADLRLLDLRQRGLEWTAIAAEVGGRPDALRVQLARAVDRVARQLGLDE